MQKHYRTTGILALALAALSACQEAPTGLLAPEAASFARVPTLLVVNSLDDDGTGCTAAKCTLRDAIADAGPGATITFSVTGTIVLTQGVLLIDKDLTISGPGATSLTVSGNNASQVFWIGVREAGYTVSISGLTITGGHAGPGFGGGIFNGSGSTLTLTHSTISGNSAAGPDGGLGGGIYNLGALALTHSTVSGNDALNAGGGIVNGSGSTLRLAHSTISGNSVLAPARAAGGGIFNSGALALTHSTVSGNGTGTADGMFNAGGGIFNSYEGRVAIANSTVATNTAGIGGGIYNAGWLMLQNSIVANSTSGRDCHNENGDDGGTVTDGGYNLVEDGSCIRAPTSRLGDPLLGGLQDNGGPTQTHALLAGSPAIDAIPFGAEGCDSGTDQRGFPRPQGGACDIGAFEAEAPARRSITVTLDANGTLTRRTGAATLSGTVTCSAPTSVPLEVTLSQQQRQGRNAITVTGSGSIEISCTGTDAWRVEITPRSGKFAAGAADATAEVAGANPPVRAMETVQLR